LSISIIDLAAPKSVHRIKSFRTQIYWCTNK